MTHKIEPFSIDAADEKMNEYDKGVLEGFSQAMKEFEALVLMERLMAQDSSAIDLANNILRALAEDYK